MILAPSILSADFARLGEDIAAAERGGAGAIHVDVHLMIENADRYLDAFVDAGATWISLHAEALPHLQRAVAYLKGRGVQAGVAINPATPLAALEEILPDLDHVLVMSVNPGFGGQKFLPGSLEKVRRLRAQITDRGLRVRIEVDGGVDMSNVRALTGAGADILVAGQAVYGGGDAEGNARRLIEAAR